METRTWPEVSWFRLGAKSPASRWQPNILCRTGSWNKGRPHRLMNGFLFIYLLVGRALEKKNPPVKWYVNTVQVNGHMAALNWAKLTFRLNWNEARTQLVSLVTQRWTHQSFPVLLTFCLFLPIWCAFGSATMLTSGNGNLKWEILNDKRQSVLYPKNISIQNFSVLWSHCLET